MSELLELLEKKIPGREPGLLDGKKAFAVLVPLVEGEEGLSLLYEVRAATLRRQPGEVCFPGGKMEPGETPEECALRETWEELGIPPEEIRVLGRLDFLAHRANFIMYPILAVVSREGMARLKINEAEVGEVFQIPLNHLLDHDPIEYEYELIPAPASNFPYEVLNIPRDYKWSVGWENVPVYPWQGHAVWGLTGKITRHLVALVKAWG